MTIDGYDRLVIVALKGGTPAHPEWYRNLVAYPIVGEEYGKQDFQVCGAVTNEPQLSELYTLFVAEMPTFGDYQRRTTQVIPVVTLMRL